MGTLMYAVLGIGAGLGITIYTVGITAAVILVIRELRKPDE
jgi:hypothetical protein